MSTATNVSLSATPENAVHLLALFNRTALTLQAVHALVDLAAQLKTEPMGPAHSLLANFQATLGNIYPLGPEQIDQDAAAFTNTRVR